MAVRKTSTLASLPDVDQRQGNAGGDGPENGHNEETEKDLAERFKPGSDSLAGGQVTGHGYSLRKDDTQGEPSGFSEKGILFRRAQ
jgi:hypothetical protein